jgi:hypothetical protein
MPLQIDSVIPTFAVGESQGGSHWTDRDMSKGGQFDDGRQSISAEYIRFNFLLFFNARSRPFLLLRDHVTMFSFSHLKIPDRTQI